MMSVRSWYLRQKNSATLPNNIIKLLLQLSICIVEITNDSLLECADDIVSMPHWSCVHENLLLLMNLILPKRDCPWKGECRDEIWWSQKDNTDYKCLGWLMDSGQIAPTVLDPLQQHRNALSACTHGFVIIGRIERADLIHSLVQRLNLDQ